MAKIDWSNLEEVKQYRNNLYKIKNIGKVRKKRTCKINWNNKEERNTYGRQEYRIKNNLPLDYVYIPKRKINWDNPEEVKAYRRELHRNNPNIRKNKKLYTLKKYNLSLEEFEEMCKTQKNRCLCCNKSVKNGKLYVDHDHITSLVRGLICLRCNSGIAFLGDNLSGLNNAVNYLSKFETSFF